MNTQNSIEYKGVRALVKRKLKIKKKIFLRELCGTLNTDTPIIKKYGK